MPRYEQYFADVTTSAKAFIELGLEQHRSVYWINTLDDNDDCDDDIVCRMEEGGFHLKVFPATIIFSDAPLNAEICH